MARAATAARVPAPRPVDVDHEPGDLIGAAEARELLGVSAATLRRWSAAGQLASYTTPGGHRRYSRHDLVAVLAASGDGRAIDMRSSAAGMAQAYRRRAPVVAGRTPWLKDLDDAQREPLRRLGRRLAEALLVALDADSASERRTAMETARRAGGEFGRLAAQRGACITETTGAFLRFRMPFLQQIPALARRRALGGAEAAELFVDATAALDELLLTVVESFAQETSTLSAVRAGAR